MLWICRPCARYMILGGEAEEEAGEALCRTSSGPCQSTYVPCGDGYSPVSLALQGLEITGHVAGVR
jgi:hypothetical protein